MSMGRVDGDQLVCGYHGLRLGRDGACVDARLARNAREAARVRNYPLVERDGILWIWMGEADQADPAQLQDYGFLEDPGNRTVRGSMVVDANYFLEVENLLDLSHLDYLHLGSIANGGLTTGTFTADQVADTVVATWESPDCPVPPQFARFFPQLERVDQWTHFRWNAPATLHLYNGVTPPGQPKGAGLEIHQGHFVTPISEKRCMYFWSVAQRKEYLPEDAVAVTRQIIANVFDKEDRPMIEAQQTRMRGVDFWSEKPVLFPEDGAAVRARKILERLIREEQQRKTDSTVT
jgi:phenylpropionate dioxygenase-like ring-hydroxylating dioxygenase large terminal subunit